MSKTIELKLREWYITYQVRAIDMKDNITKHYEASVLYGATYQEKTLTHRDRKSFATYEEAKEWIDRELQDNTMEHSL